MSRKRGLPVALGELEINLAIETSIFTYIFKLFCMGSLNFDQFGKATGVAIASSLGETCTARMT
jgi:hypothetical protein